MRAAVIAHHRKLAVIRAEPPRPGPDEVRVRLQGCGVCASNLPVWEGRPWFQYPLNAGEPGHEGWGVVDAIGAKVDSVREGERVAFLSNRAYAEYDLAKSDALVRLPRELDPFPGEALGCAMNIFRRSHIEPGHTVVIIGAGFLGSLLIQLAAALRNAGVPPAGQAASRRPVRVIAVSRRDSALALAKACGADETIPMHDHTTIVNRIRELTDGRGAERVIECVGAQGPLDLATEVIAEGGRLVIAGYHQDGPRQVNLQQWNWLGIDVVNAHERSTAAYVRGMSDAVAAVTSGRIDPRPLLTHRYALDELGTALDHVRERPDGFVKGMVIFA